jgi:hypothetical protein
MRTLTRLAVVIVVGGAALSSWTGPATAKGAHSAVITGPGLSAPLNVSADATDGSVMPNELMDATGTWFAVMVTKPSPLLDQPPPGPLGPRFRVVYELMTGADEYRPVRQVVYPFARAGFVTYTPPGQRAFHRDVRSGWYLSVAQSTTAGGMSSEDATALFIRAGVPDRRTR